MRRDAPPGLARRRRDAGAGGEALGERSDPTPSGQPVLPHISSSRHAGIAGQQRTRVGITPACDLDAQLLKGTARGFLGQLGL